MRRDAEQNRERILTAADTVFGEQGSAGTTEAVARIAGVGIATVFRHFPTKEDLVEAVLLAHFRRLSARARALSENPDAGESLTTLVRVMIEGGPTKITLFSMTGEHGALSASVRDASNELRCAVGDVLRRAQDAGAARESLTVDEVYLLIRALAQTSATMRVDESTLEGAVQIVLTGLLTV